MTPCYDDRDTGDYARAEAKVVIDKLTRMLCEVIRSGVVNAMRQNPEIEEWWEEHKNMDAARERQERVR